MVYKSGPTGRVRSMKLVTISVYFVAIVGLALWITLKTLRLRLRQPPGGYLEVVALAHRTGAPLPQAVRTPQLRRQLVLSSAQPAALTNLLQMDTSTLKVDKKLVKKPLIYGFLHPNADAGGGGERVLWAAVHQLLNSDSTAVAAIYVAAKPNSTQATVLRSCAERFGIRFSADQANRVVFIVLTQSWLVDPTTFPVLTLLGQALGMGVLGYEAISNLMPDVFIDTTGLAFSYPVVSMFAKVPILAYVHYPFIQSEMIGSLGAQLWKSPKRLLKYGYYHLLSKLYNWAGSFCTRVTVNSTWTKEHLGWSQDKEIVYPPSAVQDFPPPTEKEQRSPALVYLAQFRPEKRHDLVIKSFAKMRQTVRNAATGGKPHLILIGSVRDEIDLLLVHKLNSLAIELGLTDADYTIVQNAPWDAVTKILHSSQIGLNAMWNEHFGMGVVEVMAAGLIPVVHASAGPFLDIVKDVDPNKPAPGFLFRSARDPDGQKNYPPLSEAMASALKLSRSDQFKMRERAYLAAQRFSDAAFAAHWGQQIRAVTAEVPKFVQKRRDLKLYD